MMRSPYWLLTVYCNKHKRCHPVVWEGELSDYAVQYQNEPIMFAKVITQDEYDICNTKF